MTATGHRARKRFGQHWLVEASVLDQIVAAAALGPEDRVLEIGPGRGALTERLLQTPLQALLAVELDRDLVADLRQRFGGDRRFHLLEGDALEVPLQIAGNAWPHEDTVLHEDTMLRGEAELSETAMLSRTAVLSGAGVLSRDIVSNDEVMLSGAGVPNGETIPNRESTPSEQSVCMEEALPGGKALFSGAAVSQGAAVSNTTTPNSTTPNTVAPNPVAPNSVPPNTVPPNTVPPNTVAPNSVAPNSVAPNKVVANIPYNITGPLLERLVGRLERPVQPAYDRLVLLVQQEVGERIRATPGSSACSALTVRLQLLARCRRVCPVPPRCFQPPPKVMSEVILLEPLPPEQLLHPAIAQRLEGLLRRCFAARRKMLRNSLSGLLPAPELEALAAEAGIALNQRPQELAPSQWVALATGLNRSISAQPCG